ncbi:MAG TPA: RNA 2',3'-cyclic phosphodiesterase [Tissierellia bacterium]|nr:RNA 2',3'-cyclic phosphodiesterase [Tissierellia bacterium]
MRAFIAFDFPEQLKNQLYQIQNLLKNISYGGSWVSKDNFHITLKFLGEIEEGYVEGIGRVLKTISLSNVPINIKVNNIGYFNRKNNEYGIVWLGLEGDMDRLNAIYDFIEDNMNQMGFPKERRKFSPHITLVRRMRTNMDFNKVRNIIVPYLGNQYKLDNIALMKSEVIMNKRVYTPIVSSKLIDHNNNRR